MSTQLVLETVDAVLDALGGNTAVQKFTGVPTPQAVYQWRSRGVIASKMYYLMTKKLKARNFSAPPALWGQVEETDEKVA
ncbi:MAG: hypothetical protein AAAC47_01795 [Pararhizobium sp.]